MTEMHFEGRFLDQIAEEEIEELVTNKVRENQTLEFKKTYEHKNPAKRSDLVKDAACMANANGGYIIIGIQELNNCADNFVSIADDEIEGLLKSIQNLYVYNIDPPLDGWNYFPKKVAGNNVIMIRISKTTKSPHMVTIDQGTYFGIRDQSHNRAMTRSEIRDAFNNDSTNLTLQQINDSVSLLVQRLPEPAATSNIAAVLSPQATIEGSEKFADQCLEAFKERCGDKPMFYLAITPFPLATSSFDLHDPEVERLIKSPPEVRAHGWNMSNLGSQKREENGQLVWGNEIHNLLSLDKTGQMVWTAPINNRQFAWQQTEEEQARRLRLYPYALIEYPVSFVKLYKALLEQREISATKVVLQLCLLNIRGMVIAKGDPNSPFFDSPGTRSEPYPGTSIERTKVIDVPFDADKIGYASVKEIYSAFGVDESWIPFFDAATSKFNF